MGEELKQLDELTQENKALRDCLSRLSEASIRINESLDIDRVLQEVVDSACALTEARYGGLTVLGTDGLLQAFTTSGLTSEQRERFLELPAGMQFVEHLSGLSEPLRIKNMSGYLEAVDCQSIIRR